MAERGRSSTSAEQLVKLQPCTAIVLVIVDGTTVLLGVIAVKGARLHLHHRALVIVDGTTICLGAIAIKDARVHLHRPILIEDGTTTIARRDCR